MNSISSLESFDSKNQQDSQSKVPAEDNSSIKFLKFYEFIIL